ncbi:EpsD family peptidyl-prolyl cis-trans isomerase [Sphingomonas sp. TX0543]|uniref:EpsD family peptidyl-prolyl cis-trans isomerase n=1 Tax=unclassified Sphingomonas TaxID=196159 RepID=UPI0010F63969|nr:EpsD family peptidyl-prolyl cis-trans isomerase [Sphingomonas sp. 3P27F8]
MSKVKIGLVVATAMMLPLVAGCQKKADGQVVAVVNGQEITQQQLNAELGNTQIPQGVDRKAVMAQVLQRVIDRKLLVSKAKAEGLDQSPSYLTQISRAQDGILIDLLAAKSSKAVALPDASAAQKFVADNPSLFGQRKRYTLDQIAFPFTNDPALGAKLKAAQTMAEVEAALKSSNIQFNRGSSVLDSAALPPDAAQKIASLKPNEPFLVPQNGQLIASVIRNTEAEPVAEQQATPVATQILRRQAVEAAMKKDLDAERAKAKIEYQPGFEPPANKGAPAAAK